MKVIALIALFILAPLSAAEEPARVVCPYCQSLGEKSAVECWSVTVTGVVTRPAYDYDEEGRPHPERGIKVIERSTRHYRCSRRHSFEITDK